MNRENALQFIYENIGSWPQYIEGYRTQKLYKTYRFIDTLPEREIVFANMLDTAITEEEYQNYIKSITKTIH